jgi:hypothetical protein
VSDVQGTYALDSDNNDAVMQKQTHHKVCVERLGDYPVNVSGFTSDAWDNLESAVAED